MRQTLLGLAAALILASAQASEKTPAGWLVCDFFGIKKVTQKIDGTTTYRKFSFSNWERSPFYDDGFESSTGVFFQRGPDDTPYFLSIRNLFRFQNDTLTIHYQVVQDMNLLDSTPANFYDVKGTLFSTADQFSPLIEIAETMIVERQHTRESLVKVGAICRKEDH
jgi:hypothetical protein